MPEEQHGMKQTHGGDDAGDGEPAPEEKKPSLTKYASAPDMNIRDIFWRIMEEYAEKKGRGVDVTKYAGMKAALIRIALSVLENPESAYHGLPQNSTALYTLTMVLDGKWEDMFRVILENTATESKKMRQPIVKALKKLLQQEQYYAQLTQYFERTLKDLNYVGLSLIYLVEIRDTKLITSLKKWITVIAQTDVESNQIYAISALALLPNDEDVKKISIRLLSHWDPQTRKAVATLLQKRKDDTVRAQAERQLRVETDVEVQKLLQKLIGKKN